MEEGKVEGKLSFPSIIYSDFLAWFFARYVITVARESFNFYGDWTREFGTELDERGHQPVI